MVSAFIKLYFRMKTVITKVYNGKTVVHYEMFDCKGCLIQAEVSKNAININVSSYAQLYRMEVTNFIACY